MDRGLGLIAALRATVKLTRGARWRLLWLWIGVSCVAAAIDSLVPIRAVGLMAASVTSFVLGTAAMTAAYQMLSGELPEPAPPPDAPCDTDDDAEVLHAVVRPRWYAVHIATLIFAVVALVSTIWVSGHDEAEPLRSALVWYPVVPSLLFVFSGAAAIVGRRTYLLGDSWLLHALLAHDARLQRGARTLLAYATGVILVVVGCAGLLATAKTALEPEVTLFGN